MIRLRFLGGFNKIDNVGGTFGKMKTEQLKDVSIHVRPEKFIIIGPMSKPRLTCCVMIAKFSQHPDYDNRTIS